MSFSNALPAEMRDDYKSLVVGILEWCEAGQKIAELMLPGITAERSKAKTDEAKDKKRKRKGTTPPNPYTLTIQKMNSDVNLYGTLYTGYNANKKSMTIISEYYQKYLKADMMKSVLAKPSDTPITEWFEEYWRTLEPEPTPKVIYKNTEAGKAFLSQIKPSHKRQPASPSSSSSSSSSTSEATKRRRAEKEARKSAKKAKKSGAGRIEKVVSGKKGSVPINF
jgi:hypothetical protein